MVLNMFYVPEMIPQLNQLVFLSQILPWSIPFGFFIWSKQIEVAP